MSLHSNAAKEKFDISTHTRRSKFYVPQHDQNLIFTLIFDIAKPESRRERCGGTYRKCE